jgi:hypothetical protein
MKDHDNDNRGDSAHCAINRALDEFNEAHSPMDVDVLIEDLAAVMCEMIALYGDRDARRVRVKRIVDLIPRQVAAFRKMGRYPGGPWATGTSPNPSTH